MERDYDFDSRLYFADLDDPREIGRRAGERVVKRLIPRQVPTGKDLTVVFDPRVARGFVGHIAGAINGAVGCPQDQLPARPDGPAGAEGRPVRSPTIR